MKSFVSITGLCWAVLLWMAFTNVIAWSGMNNNKLQKLAERVLIVWGVYTRLELGASLSYMSKSTLNAFTEIGTNSPNSRTSLTWPYEAEFADNLIAKLSQIRPSWAKVIQHHYVEQKSIRDKARQLGLPKSTYYDYLRHGQQWVGKKLSARII